ncbi:MAG: hypothetical protein KJZ85_09950 [Rhodobacteraceae bacterium]|jgi:hypothetical protein|nr:hypothetical protein [Paracoccaceae bacterium]
MTRTLSRRAPSRSGRAAGLALLAAAALAVIASTDARAWPSGVPAAGGFHCGYSLRHDLGGMLMEGRIASDRPIAGSYEIRVMRRAARGMTLVTTSGSFTAALGSPASTGTIHFGDSYALQDIRMVLRINGKRWPCVELGGSL